MDVPAASTTLGLLGAICWSIQLLPQILLNYRRHNATGLQASMMLLWACAGIPLGTYNIVSDFSITLQIQAQILTTLSLLTWAQCVYYEAGWSARRAIAAVVGLGIILGGVEVGLVLALRQGVARGVQWPVTLMAVLAATLLALGVGRHYWDIYRHRTVRGISFLFVGIDALGDLTSLLSIMFQPRLEILGMVIYGVELVLWLGVFACGGYYNLTPWIKERIGRRRNGGLPSSDENHWEQGDDVTMHDLQSSTSVFRTSSADIRSRRTNTGDGRESSIAVP